LRFEATVHNTRELRCRRSLDNFPKIITRLAGMAGRFATTLDCAGISFLPDGSLDELPLPSRHGATRTGGIDLNKPRTRAALSAALALAAAPRGFTGAEHAAKVQHLDRQAGYTARQAADDLRKLRGKGPGVKPARTRRYHIPPTQARTIAALLAFRDQVIASILAGSAAPAADANPRTGPASAATTKLSASACRFCSASSASPPPQHDNILSIGELQAPSAVTTNVHRGRLGLSHQGCSRRLG
jgi:hypothetical protein